MAGTTAKGEVSERLLAMLRCPRTKKRLRRADAELLARVNASIRAGAVQDIAGTLVEKPMDGALITEDGKLLYAVIDRIPVLLPDEAIEVQRVESA